MQTYFKPRPASDDGTPVWQRGQHPDGIPIAAVATRMGWSLTAPEDAILLDEQGGILRSGRTPAPDVPLPLAARARKGR